MSLDSTLIVPLALVGFAIGVLVTLMTLRAIRRRRRPARRVEPPNSHHDSHLVQEREVRHRWHEMPLDRLHEINREEVRRLLAKVEATSPQALNDREREFLDYMAKLVGSMA